MLIVVGFVILIVSMFLVLPVTTAVQVSGQNVQWTVGFRASVLGWSKSRSWRVPMTAAQKAKPTTGWDPKRVAQGVAAFKIYRHFIEVLWAKTSVSDFSCVLHLGLPEASNTAVMTGLLNNLLGPWVTLHIAPKSSIRPVYGIYPSWDRMQIHGEFTATLRFRMLNVLQALMAALIRTGSLIIRGQ